MNKKLLLAVAGALVIILVVVAVTFSKFSGSKAQPAPASGQTDPQKLMIPRWFLLALTLDGKPVDVLAGQQDVTIQFEPENKANGAGGCNSFGADYKVSKDGKLTFGPIKSTMMACDKNMGLETAYFQTLAKVQQFKVADGQLTLSSSDGKTTVVFHMPPK